MLRLSINRSSRPRIGIALGATTVAAAQLRPGIPWEIQWSRQVSLPVMLFSHAPDAGCEDALAAALAEVAPEAARTSGPVHIALPDAGGHVAVFEFDELPGSDSARLDLVRGCFERDRHLNAASMACCCQALGTEDGKQLLYASAVEQSWLDCIRRALDRAGIVPWAVDTSVAFHFNRLGEWRVNANDAQSGGMVVVGPQSWTLLIWDGVARPRLVKSRWCDGLDREPGCGAEEVSGEIQRLIQAYVHGEERRALWQLYVCGVSARAQEIATELRVRSGGRVARIDPLAGLGFDESPDPATHGAVTAAVGR